MIRPAIPSDLPHLIAMGERFLRDTGYGARLASNPGQMEATARRLIETDGLTVLVAEHAGTLIGMIGMVTYPDPFSAETVAAEMFWWSELPGAGIRLLKAAEAWAREVGAARIQMVAPTDDVASIYERLGYDMTERAYMRSLP